MKERPKKWTREQLIAAVESSTSFRQVIQKLGLVPAGGNYVQVQSYSKKYRVDTRHFNGKGWRVGTNTPVTPARPLESLLVKNSNCNTHGLKLRLWNARLKPPLCEICKWAKVTPDGRLPLELDHIKGDRYDNRLENLRILCPNCHSLQSTHRGKNKKRK